MKWLAVLLLASNSTFAQYKPDLSQILWQPESIYIITRATASKGGQIAASFNIADACATHVALALRHQNKLFVYHVSNDYTGKSALISEPIENFTNRNDLQYFAVWECKTDRKTTIAVYHTISNFDQQLIGFDMQFDAETDRQLYCSEFCAKVLMRSAPAQFEFPLTVRQLDNFYAMLLERSYLSYWPVDFFESSMKFTKIYEIDLYQDFSAASDFQNRDK